MKQGLSTDEWLVPWGLKWSVKVGGLESVRLVMAVRNEMMT